jgi:multidrug transporter EmrE-like cation transporter
MSELAKSLILIICSVALGIAGQLCIKMGVTPSVIKVEWLKNLAGGNKIEPDKKVGSNIFSSLLVFLRPFVILGLIIYGLSAVIWLMVLSRTELSFAYPMVATGYVFVFILSLWLFGDQVNFIRVLGLSLIVAGVICVASSGRESMNEDQANKPVTTDTTEVQQK